MTDAKKIENMLRDAGFRQIRDAEHSLWEKHGVRVGVSRSTKNQPHAVRSVRASIRRAERAVANG